ncbi:hypothetical protein BJF83_10350 [Nocardiopsis sp. CNR-923]|nr:hypothetical protein [Nocardiopsis sp. CNR-923]OLT29759.1 hypothetical protein BJF83_10350 [Nocardiopsis sp. CNR-923]
MAPKAAATASDMRARSPVSRRPSVDSHQPPRRPPVASESDGRLQDASESTPEDTSSAFITVLTW